MQQLLVTGDAGHLGRLVAKHLSQAGYRVRGMSRRASPGEDWPGAEWKQADLVTGAGVEEAVKSEKIECALPFSDACSAWFLQL